MTRTLTRELQRGRHAFLHITACIFPSIPKVVHWVFLKRTTTAPHSKRRCAFVWDNFCVISKDNASCAKPMALVAWTDDIMNSYTGSKRLQYTFAFFSLTIAFNSKSVYRKAQLTQNKATRRSNTCSNQLGEHFLAVRIYHYHI